ncbi:hypothetical protein ACT4XN_19350 (plasmid) [Acinetobacter baumannii]
MKRSTLGMTKQTMLGNKNSVKEVVKEDRFQARMNYEDKQKLLKFCNENKLSLTDYLIKTMVDNGILPESRRPVKED